MRLKRTFTGSKLNKDLDERLLPAGEYPHAENIRVANTDASDVGSAENVKGNFPLTSFALQEATTIGAYADGANQKIYWFVTSKEKDMVIEYDNLNSITTVLLESSKNTHNVLNFDKNFLITGVVKIINGDSDKDLLVWTDDLNAPRMINIQRARTYGANNFDEDDISLIKKPPRFAPRVQLTFTSTTLENNLEDKFISFAYRYKYLDGEYSALSSFTNYKFAPREFDIDFQTMENNGMTNFFNAMNVFFDTGDKRVTDIEIVYKESNSNTLFIVETFNKKKENWGNNQTKSFKFANSKKYAVLPDDELYRQYDNVPRLAKALELIGNRLVFGNYVEGYDLKDVHNQDIYVSYDVSLVNKELLGVEVPVQVNGDKLTLNLNKVKLKQDSRINFEIILKERNEKGEYKNNLDFILNKDYNSVTELAQDEDFIFFIEDIMTNNFLQNYTATPPANSNIGDVKGFKIVSSTGTNLVISAPVVNYNSTTGTTTRYWDFNNDTNVYYREISIDTSLKTNRSYEVGIIYLDKYNRATTVLTDTSNTMYVPQEFSTYQNKLQVNLHSNPPYWADRYKFVVKQNKEQYETIYTNLFYEDGLFRWIKLEGANKNKVKEGDTLIVKSDLGGVVRDLTKVRVLEIAEKDKDFIEDNENQDGAKIIEESGLYMKIKPSGFDMNFSEATSRTFEGGSHRRYTGQVHTNPVFGDTSGGTFTPFELNAGSTVRIFINFKARGKIAYEATYDKRFRVEGNYGSVKEWFEKEVKNLGSFGKEYTYGGDDEWNKGSGWGFTDNGDKFWVRSHRNGTASRKITTDVRFEILFTEGMVIFETEPKNTDNDIFYETEDTFEIVNGRHTGNIQNQTSTQPAVTELDFYNCYVQGNGAESYKYKDVFNSPFLNIDTRPTAVAVEQYKEVRRYADLTYSSPYNENNNVNGLNEFNLSRANYKEDIDKKYGYIQKLHSRDTDLLVFQEDKVSKVLFGKDLLMNADGTYNLSAIEDVLGRQVSFMGEYGISRNPESFSYNGFQIYFTDAKRGAVMVLQGDGLHEISSFGLRQYFKDEFKVGINNKKIGAFDPYYDEYVIHPSVTQMNLPMNISCRDTVVKTDYTDRMSITMEYGMLIGDAGFNYSTNGIPIMFTLEYDGKEYSTGFVGDSKYNKDLNDLGLPNVSSSGVGTLTFNKDKLTPTKALIKVYSPFCGVDFNLTGNCIFVQEKGVTFIVGNDPTYKDKSNTNRFKWIKDDFSSSFKSDETVFTEGYISHFEELVGEQGSGFIPMNGSRILMEAYSPYNSETVFELGGKFGYLLSNTKYNESEIQGIRGMFTPVPATKVELQNGDVVYNGEFTLPNTLNEKYIYLLYDYTNPIKAIDDLFTVGKGKTKVLDVQENDELHGVTANTVIVEQPKNGSVGVNADGTVTYIHNDTDTLEDSFKYVLEVNGLRSNIATVKIDIAMSCDESFTQSGGQGYHEIQISYGTEIGECGITYDMYTIPDEAEIIWDGRVVASTGGLVSGRGNLLFNKNKALPSTATIKIGAPESSTAWEITGICPMKQGVDYNDINQSGTGNLQIEDTGFKYQNIVRVYITNEDNVLYTLTYGGTVVNSIDNLQEDSKGSYIEATRSTETEQIKVEMQTKTNTDSWTIEYRKYLK